MPLVPNQILKILDTNPPGESGWFLAADLSQIVNNPRKGFVAAAYVSVYPLIMPQVRLLFNDVSSLFSYDILTYPGFSLGSFGVHGEGTFYHNCIRFGVTD